MISVHFSEIRSSIIKEIVLAKKNIKVAVYWFTNIELFDLLCLKQSQGVNCTLIIHNDYINNRDTGLPFQKFIEAGGKFYFSSEEHPMHNKFCVIDNQVLINGSYNWTYYAESKNQENVLIIKDESTVIAEFESEFDRLIENLNPINEITKLTKFEIEENNLLRNRDYLAHDLIYQAKSSNRPDMVNTAFEIAPENLSIQKIANDLGLINSCKLKSSIWISIINDGVKLVASKGAILPATFSTIARTTVDNQTKTISNVVFGEFDKASANRKLATMELKGLPKKPAGQAVVKFTISIDIDGNLRIEMMSLDTGEKQTIAEKAEYLIE